MIVTLPKYHEAFLLELDILWRPLTYYSLSLVRIAIFSAFLCGRYSFGDISLILGPSAKTLLLLRLTWKVSPEQKRRWSATYIGLGTLINF